MKKEIKKEEHQVYMETTPAIEKKKKKRIILIVIFSILLLLVITGVVLYFTVFKKNNKPTNDPGIVEGTYYSHKFTDLDKTIYIISDQYKPTWFDSEGIIDTYKCNKKCTLKNVSDKNYILDDSFVSIGEDGKFKTEKYKNYDKTEFANNKYITFFDAGNKHFLQSNIRYDLLEEYEYTMDDEDYAVNVDGTNIEFVFSKSSLKNGNIGVFEENSYVYDGETKTYRTFNMYNLKTKKTKSYSSIDYVSFYKDLVILQEQDIENPKNERHYIYNANMNRIFDSYALYSSKTMDGKYMLLYPIYEEKDDDVEELDEEDYYDFEYNSAKRYQLYKINEKGKIIKESEEFIDYYGYHQGTLFLVTKDHKLEVIREDDFSIYDTLEGFKYDENKTCEVEYSNEKEKYEFSCK